MSSSWKLKRSASTAASSTPGRSTWIHVSPLAESSEMRGSTRSATAAPALRPRPRLMRGSVGLAIRTERIVELHLRSTRFYLQTLARPPGARGGRGDAAGEEERGSAGAVGAPAGQRVSPRGSDAVAQHLDLRSERRVCAWQDSNLRPCAPEAHALSPELQAREP